MEWWRSRTFYFLAITAHAQHCRLCGLNVWHRVGDRLIPPTSPAFVARRFLRNGIIKQCGGDRLLSSCFQLSWYCVEPWSIINVAKVRKIVRACRSRHRRWQNSAEMYVQVAATGGIYPACNRSSVSVNWLDAVILVGGHRLALLVNWRHVFTMCRQKARMNVAYVVKARDRMISTEDGWTAIRIRRRCQAYKPSLRVPSTSTTPLIS